MKPEIDKNLLAQGIDRLGWAEEDGGIVIWVADAELYDLSYRDCNAAMEIAQNSEITLNLN